MTQQQMISTIMKLEAENAKLQDEVLRVQTRYEQLEIHNVKLDEEIAKLRVWLGDASERLRAALETQGNEVEEWKGSAQSYEVWLGDSETMVAKLRAALEQIVADVTLAANNGARGAISVRDIARAALNEETK